MRMTPVFLGAAMALAGAAARGAPSDLKVGFAARVINPDKPMAPIGHRSTTPVLDIHADLRVGAMAAEDGAGTRVIFLGWDFCNVLSAVADRVKGAIHERLGVEPAAVCINASHTHSAPPLLESEAMEPELFDAVYAEFVIGEAIAAAVEAFEKRRPARVRYCEYPCTAVAVNRRLKTGGAVTMQPNFAGTVDHRAQVLAVDDAQSGALMGVVVKYACHPVTVGPAGLGSDYPGFMRAFIEERHPGAVALFLQGCGADARIQITDFAAGRFVREDVVREAERFGRHLGMSVEWALAQGGTPVTGPIAYRATRLDLPVGPAPGQQREDAAAAGEDAAPRPTSQPYRIQAFGFGAGGASPWITVALQGEVFAQYGLSLADRLRGARVVVLGYSNHIAGYVCTAEAIREGGYEPTAYTFWKSAGPYTTEAEPMILDAAASLARDWIKPPAPAIPSGR